MSLEEMKKKVYERYPIKEKEKTCMSFAQRQQGLRESYMKRLIQENDLQRT